MYQIYAKAVGEDIYKVFQNQESEIIHASDYYTTWRLDDIGVAHAVDSNILTPPFFVVDFDFFLLQIMKLQSIIHNRRMVNLGSGNMIIKEIFQLAVDLLYNCFVRIEKS